MALSVAPVLAWLLAGGPEAAGRGGQPDHATISIVGTTDLHGRIFTVDGRGGLALLGGYLANLRAARAADGGAVVLLDSGDTYQGGIESNLSEGAVVIDAYNALGYTAAAIGNHDFEFGPVDAGDTGEGPADDFRGALKARAVQARFPFLAANLREHGRPVTWPNVSPSVVVEAAGVKVGIVGVMTHDALSMTLTANVGGLAVAGLADTIAAEAGRLRADGARLVVVASHAGGHCAEFGPRGDLSSCDASAEMFEVARRLPRGLVNVIVAGHTHSAVAHEVNGVAIVQAYYWGHAFSRVDVAVDRGSGRVAGVRIFDPRDVCAREDAAGRCVPETADRSMVPRYEGRPVVPDAAVEAAMAPALRRVATLRATPLGAVLDMPVPRGSGEEESALGNLYADALRNLAPETDAAISYSIGPGGLRADLAAGPVTIGAVYDAYPFDNRAVRLTLTGTQLRELLTAQLRRPRWRGRAFGVSGIRVVLDCRNGELLVDAVRASGAAIGDRDTLTVAMSDFMAARALAMAPSDGAWSRGAPAADARRGHALAPRPRRADERDSVSRPLAPALAAHQRRNRMSGAGARVTGRRWRLAARGWDLMRRTTQCG